MKKNTVRIVGYCSRWEEGVGWVVDVPLEDLAMAIAKAETKKKRYMLGYCECCGCEIYVDDVHKKIDDVIFCDYCGGENGLAISEMEDKE